jgi:hypothetical protein
MLKEGDGTAADPEHRAPSVHLHAIERGKKLAAA